ncbi:hypothetical protein phiOC_p220 [Ochrobactrum phage vB_OspM_OC]|nr:hypothetical protein phiOC_p220 [Ochrobactrum phage vB_OspM_OC]
MTDDTYQYIDEEGISESLSFDSVKIPSEGNTYYFFYSISNSNCPFNIGQSVWSGNHLDITRYKSGNYFESYDQAALTLGFFVGILQSRIT